MEPQGIDLPVRETDPVRAVEGLEDRGKGVARHGLLVYHACLAEGPVMEPDPREPVILPQVDPPEGPRGYEPGEETEDPVASPGVEGVEGRTAHEGEEGEGDVQDLPCRGPPVRRIIDWEGSVSACCGDYDNLMIVGDLERDSLSAIWHSDALNRFREMLVAGRHDELPLCRSCYDALETQTPGLQKTGLT